MRFFLMICSAVLVLASGFAHAEDDMKAKCEQALSKNAEKIDQVKQLGSLLGNKKVDETIAKAEEGCEKLGGSNSADEEETSTKEDSKAADAAAALKSVGALFGKKE